MFAQPAEAEAFPGWFKVLIVRKCYRYLRQKRHPTVALDDNNHLAGKQVSLADIVEQREMQRNLHAAIEDLTPNMRLAVQLFYFHGYSTGEISSCFRPEKTAV